jgi:hypothetical protein
MNNTNASKLISQTNPTIAVTAELGVDQKGRTVGACVWVGEAVFGPLPENHEGCHWVIAPGHYFTMCGEGLRDGKSFGASRNTRYFSTKAELDAAVAGFMKSAAKTQQKRAAK